MNVEEINIYVENGYTGRREYLESLAEDYGIPLRDVWTLSRALGKEEDFDALITTLENYNL